VHAGATPGTGNSSSATYSTVKYVVPDTLASDRLLQMERLLGYSGGPAVLLYEGMCAASYALVNLDCCAVRLLHSTTAYVSPASGFEGLISSVSFMWYMCYRRHAVDASGYFLVISL
jgi:hypothetical protein